MSLSNIEIVLVKPKYGGNVGSVCRAMKNMGLGKLKVVSPEADLTSLEAKKMSTHAYDLLTAIEVFSTLETAVAGCVLVAVTTARMGLYRSHAKTAREWAPHFLKKTELGSVAIVFGAEDKGLANDDLAVGTHIIQIPSAPNHTSLNLAQAVLICAYELYLASGEFEPVQEKSEDAPIQLRERMFSLWREALLEIGFMEEDKADHMMMGLRRVLSRGSLSVDDIKILMGIARQSQWCATEMKKFKDS